VTSELFEHLRDQAERRPDAVALLVDGEPSSYRRLLEDAESLARGLSSLGVRRGDRVTLHLANLPELFIAYHACFRIGALACPLNTRLTASELRPVLELVRPTVHLGGTALVDRLGDALGSLIPADTCYLVGDGPMPAGTRVFADLLLAHDQGVRTDVAGMDREDGADAGAWQDEPAVLLGTSGTTGEIKLVAHTQATLSAAAQTLGRGPIGDDAVALDTSPMVHAGGLTFVLAQLGKGVSIAVLSRPATGQGVLDAVERDRCGFVGGLPVIFSQMLQAQREHPRDLSSLRHCISGGDVVDEDVQRGFREEIGVRLHQMWSATEVPGGMTYGLEDGPVSRTLEGTDVRLVDAARHDVARGQSGELLVQNTVVAQGYWRGRGTSSRSTRPAGSPPETSSSRVRTATCASSPARRSSSCGGAPTSRRQRWSWRCAPARTSPTPRWSACPTRRWGSASSPLWCPRGTPGTPRSPGSTPFCANGSPGTRSPRSS